jgi:nucleoside-diphosphate-sugar epimerase
MRILVTGASGFIGGEVAECLATNPNLNIIATGRSLTNRFDGFPNVEYIQVDLTKQIPSFECDVCIHCAGLADDRASEKEFMKNNVLATQQLITSISGCRKFIFISSSSVYDFSDGQPKKEEHALLQQKLSPYGKTKLIAEKYVSESGTDSVVVLRPRAVYGKNDRVLLPRIIKLLKGRLFFVPGNLEAITSLTHIGNLLETVIFFVFAASKGTHIYNVADASPYHLKTVFQKIGQDQTGCKIRFIHIPVCVIKKLVAFTRALGIKTAITQQSLNYLTLNSVTDTTKIQKETGLQPILDFFRDF